MSKEIFGLEFEVYLQAGVTYTEVIDQIKRQVGEGRTWPSAIDYGQCHAENTQDFWKLAFDSSLSHGGIEIVARRRVPLAEVERVLKATRQFIDLPRMARTSNTGFHVHIGIMSFGYFKRRHDTSTREGRRKASYNKCVKVFDIRLNQTYAYFQSVLNALVSASRRTSGGRAYNGAVRGSYERITDTEKEAYFKDRNQHAPRDGNRGVVNFGKLVDYGTVEFRQHQGTYNVTTAINWSKLMHRITSRSWNPKHSKIDLNDYPVTVDGLSDFLGLGQNRLRAWMKRRVRHFGFEGLARDQPHPNTVESLMPETVPNPADMWPEETVPPQNMSTAEYDLTEERNALHESIVLACSNHEPTYRRLRSITNFDAENIRVICGDVPIELLPEGAHSVTLWDSLNWQSIRIELMEVINQD